MSTGISPQIKEDSVKKRRRIFPETSLTPEPMNQVDSAESIRSETQDRQGLGTQFTADRLNEHLLVSESLEYALQNDLLIEVAKILLKLDYICVAIVKETFDCTWGDDWGAWIDWNLEPCFQSAAQVMQIYEKALISSAKIHVDYLRNDAILVYWEKASAYICTLVEWEDEVKNEVDDIFVGRPKLKEFAKECSILANLLIGAANSSEIDYQTRALILRRWSALDGLIDEYHDREHSKRKLENSREISMILKNICVPAHDKTRRYPRRTSWKIGIGNWTSVVMWATFVATIGMGLPLIALGFRQSSRLVGSTAEADFWFLLQNSSMTLLSLFTLAYPLQKPGVLKSWSSALLFVAIGAAVVCAVIAPILYVHIPTEWSALVSAVAGAVVSFIAVQVTVLTDGHAQSNKANMKRVKTM